MAKRVYMFGARNLERARQHIQRHPGKDLVMLRAPDRRLAVCNRRFACVLREQGFTPIDEA